ncbi:elongation factor P [candidate division KSB1 bacterium]|nr:MAG: elongation factor P [candidate division KSB1 bacterium]
MATTSDFRNGLVINLDGELFTIVYFQHVKPGKGGAFVRTKLKNVKTGRVLDRTFRSGEKVEDVRLERKHVQFLYNDGSQFVFMDTNSYEQIFVDPENVGDASKFLIETMEVELLMHGNQALGVDLPIFVELTITKTDPGVRGDTASGGSKPATLESGAVVQVPLFIEEGEKIKVDTRTGEYVERVKN